MPNESGISSVKIIIFFIQFIVCGFVHADDGFKMLDIGRINARLPIFEISRPDALATLVLLPGANAATGRVVNGQPTSDNFLSRSRLDFVNEKFNVIVVYRPSDLPSLDYEYRVSNAHMIEISNVVAYAQQKFDKPVWLVGTSRGSVSAAAAAIFLGNEKIQGLVLLSSVTNGKVGAIPSQDMASLKIQTLVVHHKNDACPICVPAEASKIIDAMHASPKKEFVLIEGGFDPVGNPCTSKNWHGYINYEKETVKKIATWIQSAMR